MKNASLLVATAMGVLLCSFNGMAQTVDKQATKETKALLKNLKNVSKKHVMFGHHQATEYGHAWRGDADRSDVKDVTGSHPAVIGVDFGGLSTTEPERAEKNIKFVSKVIMDTYKRGGVTTVTWHSNNPLTGGSFYAKEGDTLNTVAAMLPGGAANATYNTFLKNIAQVAHSIKGEKGESVPVIFRPFHEYDGEWFWWGKTHCSREQFIGIWKYTVNYLRDTLNVHNFIYAISPDCRFNTEEEFLDRYPGDDYVDMVGFDDYWDFRPDGANDPELALKKLRIISKVAKDRNKVAAFTETGLEQIADTSWYTKTLLPILKDKDVKVAYVMVWRNAHDIPTHYYTPFTGHKAAQDFINFCNDDLIFLEKDLSSMYK